MTALVTGLVTGPRPQCVSEVRRSKARVEELRQKSPVRAWPASTHLSPYTVNASTASTLRHSKRQLKGCCAALCQQCRPQRARTHPWKPHTGPHTRAQARTHKQTNKPCSLRHVQTHAISPRVRSGTKLRFEQACACRTSAELSAMPARDPTWPGPTWRPRLYSTRRIGAICFSPIQNTAYSSDSRSRRPRPDLARRPGPLVRV